MTIGLYIHIPFCLNKCAYCDFFSFKANPSYVSKYIKALIKEISERSVKNISIDSIYIGGGTPSIIESSQIANILAEVANKFSITSTAEVTIEMNPESISEEKIKEYKKNGVNRVSVGIQTFNEACLKRLHRKREDDIKKVMNTVISNFKNVSVDLMFNIPDQKMIDLVKDIVSIPREVTHVSYYSLTIEEGTSFYKQIKKHQILLPSVDIQINMQEKIIKELKKKGFERYEISNYSKKGKESRHNLHYWKGDDYLGFGVGAVSTINKERITNTKNIKKYLSGETVKDIEIMTNKIQEQEFIMLSFRLTKGLDLDKYNKKFNKIFLIEFSESINKWKEYLQISQRNVKLNTKGFHLYNEIVSDFF